MRLAPLAVLLLAGPALAQTRPLLTEEATTGPAGSLLLETGAEFIGTEPNFLTGGRRSRWDVPVLRLVYSPADKVDVDVEWTARIIAVDDPDYGTVSDFGDVVLRTKLCFVDGRNRGGPSFGARFTLSLPETSSLEGLGPNTLRMSAQFLLTTGTRDTQIHLNAGFAVEDRPLEPHSQSDFLAYGVAVEHYVGAGLSALAEANGRGVGKGSPGADRRGEARAGLRYDAGRYLFDVAVRRGYEEADGHWGFGLGFGWRIR